jgi:hypothetical protein
MKSREDTMKLKNKSKDRLKRTNEQGKFQVILPGEIMEVSDAVGQYLLKAEKHSWSKVKAPAKKQGKDGE